MHAIVFLIMAVMLFCGSLIVSITWNILHKTFGKVLSVIVSDDRRATKTLLSIAIAVAVAYLLSADLELALKWSSK